MGKEGCRITRVIRLPNWESANLATLLLVLFFFVCTRGIGTPSLMSNTYYKSLVMGKCEPVVRHLHTEKPTSFIQKNEFSVKLT